MSFFHRALRAIRNSEQGKVFPSEQTKMVLTFGKDYAQKTEEIATAIKRGLWNGSTSVDVDFDQALLQEIDDCIETHSATDRVLYSEDSHFLDVVGESFNQTELQELYSEVGDQWR